MPQICITINYLTTVLYYNIDLFLDLKARDRYSTLASHYTKHKGNSNGRFTKDKSHDDDFFIKNNNFITQKNTILVRGFMSVQKTLWAARPNTTF